jgi:hypothetical protein
LDDDENVVPFVNFVLPLVIQQNLGIGASVVSTPEDYLVAQHLWKDPADHPVLFNPIDRLSHFSLEKDYQPCN